MGYTTPLGSQASETLTDLLFPAHESCFVTGHKPLATVVDAFSRRRILVVGDLMLDRFVTGEVSRISPEAAVPVLVMGPSEDRLGGGANVARGITALGARCDLVGLVGDDEAGAAIAQALEQIETLDAELLTRTGGITTVKTRFVSSLHDTHLLRADREDTSALDEALEDALIARVRARLPRVDAVILSDYRKGVLSPRVVSAISALAGAAQKPIVVDPKGFDYDHYAGVCALTPNLAELGQALGGAVKNDDDAVAAAGRKLIDRLGCGALLVTRGDKGVTALHGRRAPVTHRASAKAVVDVTGAGDTVVATFTLALACGSGVADSARLANAAAGVVVAKRGTATVSASELRAALVSRHEFRSKLLRDADRAALAADEWRRQGLVVGFTNGCFDLLHPGHIALLEEARNRCDRLIVGLNADASVARLKGPTRPIQDAASRALVMVALSMVDGVVIFEEVTPIRLIEAIRPDRLIKGADYALEQVVGHDLVQAYGGRVELIDLVPDASTSRLVAAARDRR